MYVFGIVLSDQGGSGSTNSIQVSFSTHSNKVSQRVLALRGSGGLTLSEGLPAERAPETIDQMSIAWF